MLIPITDLEFIQGNKLSLNSPIVKAGLRQLQKKKMVKVEEYENVIELDELLLTIWEIAQEEDKRNGNKNAEE